MSTTRAVSDSLARYRALTSASASIATVLEYQLDEETGIRGYAETRNRSLLDPYAGAKSLLPQAFATLRKTLTNAHEAVLLPDVDHLTTLNARWRREIAGPTLRTSDPRKAAALEVRGKPIVDEYRGVTAAMDARLDSSVRVLSDELASKLRSIFFFSSLLVVLCAVVIFGIAKTRSSARRRLWQEQAHREATERAALQLLTLVEAIPQIVWIADRNGVITYFNERWYSYTGRTRADSPDTDWLTIVHPDDRAETERKWQSAVRSGIAYEVECRLRSALGPYRWFVTRAVPERDAKGAIVQWIGSSTDVNAQHLQLEETQRVADAFASAQLPESLPLSSLVRFDATYLPAEITSLIGGDWYDVFEIDENHFLFSVGDVTGHGLEAAVIMTRIRQAILSVASVETDPATILERANRILRMQGDDTITAACGLYDACTGEITYASAGHPPALLRRRDGSISELSSLAPPLGVLDDLKVPPVKALLGPGDLLVCYTDGIIENERDVIVGDRNLRRAINRLTPLEHEEAATAIRERLLGGRRGRDDIAILVIERLGGEQDLHASNRTGPAEKAGSLTPPFIRTP